ncbi:MAG: DNA-3-methyladenine glycosylase I [Bacteroidia bacterium]
MNDIPLVRCGWSNKNELYQKYHDEEWGVPVYDDKKLFEFIILEGAQAGLSWIAILRRREGYRKAFANFEVKEVASFDKKKVDELLCNRAIIRNKLKINAAIGNAQNFIRVQKEFGSFSNYIWRFNNGKVIMNHPKTLAEIPATSKESDTLSKDLKMRGFKFVGSTIMYAHMQATGMVNDHLEKCWCKYRNA